MKRIVIIMLVALGLMAGTVYAQMSEGHMMDRQDMMGESQGQTSPQGPGGGYGYGMMGGMGPGMMGSGICPGYGYGMMGGMGPGMMMGRGMMGYGNRPGYGYGMMGGMGPGMMMGRGMMGYGNRPGYGYGMMGGMGPGMMMGRGMMGGMGPGRMGYEAAYGYSKDYKKFLDDTVKLRKELYSKKFDYFETVRKGDAKPGTVKKLRQEIYGLQKKIAEKIPKTGF